MKKLKNFFLLKKNHHNPLLFNGLLLLCSFIIFLLFFSNGKPIKIDYIYTFGFVTLLFFPAFIIFYALIPKFLKREKYFHFSILYSFTIITFAFISTRFLNNIIALFFPDYFFISYLNTIETYIIFFMYVTLVSLLKLAEDWVYYNAKENQDLYKEKELIKTKLLALKNQINPHFLFNSLNVLYSLSLEKKEETTTAVLQLSDILRYIIYDVNSETITLKKEIQLIENYIKFEKNRQIKGSKITFHHSIDENEVIYPMLLLPIIENAFKHGLKSGVKNPYVTINLELQNKLIRFNVENNFIQLLDTSTENNSGVGLKNVQQNLSIVYPNKHNIWIDKTEDTFNVQLEIQLTT